MSRWLPSFVSLQPGMVRPRLVTRGQVFLAAKTAIAAGLAWVAALAADPGSQPFFAPLAVILVVQPTVYDSLSRALQRIIGVLVGVAAALAVSRVLAPSAWSIGIIIFAGLLAGWTARLGPQGVVQIPVSALLVFLVGQATPGYADKRIIDTLIGAGVAVIAVLLTPSAPAPDAVMSQALVPLHRCTEILRAISTGIASTWTPGQADSWRRDAAALTDSVATARRQHEGVRLSTRWNARARRQRAALGQAEEAIRSGERIASYIRSMARALADGSGHAHPMSALSAMLASTASATGAYAAWLASAGTPADRRRLAATVHAADDTLTRALARVQERWGSDPAQWLTFGTTLAMSQRILAEAGRPIDPAERESA
jgi:uncharacterized membrane protein YgaE (UPF0421/DUF939 family)